MSSANTAQTFGKCCFSTVDSKQSSWLDWLAVRGIVAFLSILSTVHVVFLARWIGCKGEIVDLMLSMVCQLPVFVQNLGVSLKTQLGKGMGMFRC